jgi:hypothetical protein
MGPAGIMKSVYKIGGMPLLVSFTEKLSKVLIRQGLASLLNGMAACIDLHLDFSSEKSTDVKKTPGLAP